MEVMWLESPTPTDWIPITHFLLIDLAARHRPSFIISLTYLTCLTCLTRQFDSSRLTVWWLPYEAKTGTNDPILSLIALLRCGDERTISLPSHHPTVSSACYPVARGLVANTIGWKAQQASKHVELCLNTVSRMWESHRKRIANKRISWQRGKAHGFQKRK